MRVRAWWLLSTSIAVLGACSLLTDLGDLSHDGDSGPLGPSCGSGMMCIAGAPAGWHPIAYAGGTQTSCPAGYGAAATKTYENVVAPDAICFCTCGAQFTAGSCETGNTLNLASGTNGVCTQTTLNLSADSFCHGASQFSPSTSIQGTAVPPENGQCQAYRDASVPDASWDNGAMCALPVTPGQGSCSDNQLCVPQPTGAYATCVGQAIDPLGDGGVPDCPQGYPNPHLVAISLYDTRGCGGQCACTAQVTCSNAHMDFFKQTCPGTPTVSVPLDGNCNTLGGTGTFASWQYHADASIAPCSATNTPDASGHISQGGQTMICCP